MDGVDIVPVPPDEWGAYRLLRLAALADTPSAYCSTLEGEVAKTEAEWRARLGNGVTFAARVSGGRPIGIATGIPGERDGNAELVGMWVHPEWRGRGVGGLLVEAVLAWARSQGRFQNLDLWVAADNPGAEALYARYGFARTGVAEPMRADEPDRVVHEMTLPLAAPVHRPG
jgi:GNAT superfamily N-acetyltransferase